MKMSELSKTTGVSTASIKYYLREGMLPAGRATGPRDADYTESHVERLEIIRNLQDTAQLPIATIKRLLGAVDDQAVPIPQLVAMAHSSILTTRKVTAQERELAAQLLTALDWTVPERSPVFGQLAHLLGILHQGQAPTDPDGLAPWLAAAGQVTQTELGLVRTQGSRALLVHDVVIGTYLSNQLLVTLHMAAQVNQAMKQFGG
ncbi:MerR family transcriptional regulator [Deinococcus frigens]|uniref:MerR family transcriptional regulator n=1 Tax=Deinococcus frigens TaxID=249403 RepID=UPI0004972E12|nr:MerR family transcriptional regulator [Deinococcus frigens]